MVRTVTLVPDAVGVRAGEPEVLVVGKSVVQWHEVAKEDSLELNAIGTAIGFASVVEDAVLVTEPIHRRRRDVLRRSHQRAVRILSVELDKAAQDHTLVVAPGGSVIVLAIAVQSIVDQIVGIDHPGFGEPLPF